MKTIVTIFAILVSVTYSFAQNTASSSMLVVVPADTVDVSQLYNQGEVVVVPTLGTRMIVETYVSTVSNKGAASTAATTLRPSFVTEGNILKLSSTEMVVNGEFVTVRFLIKVPKHLIVK